MSTRAALCVERTAPVGRLRPTGVAQRREVELEWDSR